MNKRYEVDMTTDDPNALWLKLDEIARSGRQVVTVMWLPTREVVDGAELIYTPSGYTIVSEYSS
jgi:hypothetical protein